jgi:hypothetical protein
MNCAIEAEALNDDRNAMVRRVPAAATSRDQDIHKGAMEDERPGAGTNAPGLDENGLPVDETAIAEDALGAREDGSQG